MKTRHSIAGLIAGAVLGSGVAMAADSDTDRSNPETFVKDSAITTEVKAKLTADHMSSLARIHVDTDKEGVVWLSGTDTVMKHVSHRKTEARRFLGKWHAPCADKRTPDMVWLFSDFAGA